ncbi:MAG: hypothetical protein OXK16_10915 [bacterium]|nr:hypothetical protein [bacterium]
MDVGLAWLFLLSLIGVIFVIVLPDRMTLKSSEHRIERLEEKLWDLQAELRSMRVDVSTLERGQARLDDRVPEMSSALRNLTVDLASVKRWS